MKSVNLANRYKPDKTVVMLGHLEHGRTTLASAITKVLSKDSGEGLNTEFRSYDDLDRAPELEAGGYSRSSFEYDGNKNKYIGIDLPSNDATKKFLHSNTIPDAAVLVISAADGPQLHTKDHIFLAKQRGINEVIVFLNKCDLVDDDELIDLVETEIRELFDTYEYDGDSITIIQGAALKALQENGSEEEWSSKIKDLINALDNQIPEPDSDSFFLMTIEDVDSLNNDGKVVASGKIKSGKIKVDDVVVSGTDDDNSMKVLDIKMFNASLNEGTAGDNVGLHLKGEITFIDKGRPLVKKGSIGSHTSFMGAVIYPKVGNGQQPPIRDKTRLQFNFWGKKIQGKVRLPADVEQVLPDDHVTFEVNLDESVVLRAGIHFKLLDASNTIGMGFVTEVIE